MQDIYRDLEKGADLNQVSSHGLRENLKNYVFKWLASLPSTSQEKKDEYNKKISYKLGTTAGSENANYILYWTNEDLLSMFGVSLFTEPA